MLTCLSCINVSEEQTCKLMCETEFDPSVLSFIVQVIRMAALLHVSADFLRIC